MSIFPSARELGNQFVKAYFSCAATDVASLPKFYEENACIIRGGRVINKNAQTSGKDIEITLKPGSAIYILTYKCVVIPGNQYMVNIKALLQEGDANSYVLRTFLLVEQHGRIFIRSDVANFVSPTPRPVQPERFFAAGPLPRPSAPAPAPAPAKPSEPKPAPKPEPKPEAKPEPKPEAKPTPKPEEAKPQRPKRERRRQNDSRFVYRAPE